MNKRQKAVIFGFACGFITGLAMGSIAYGKGGHR